MTIQTISTLRRQIEQGDQIDPRDMTPDVIDYHIRYGNHLRAAVFASWLRRLGQGIARLWRPAPVPVRDESPAEKFANGLAAIRSSAELLRDERDLTPAEWAKFVRMVLEEEARLEALVRQVSNGLRPAGSMRAT